MKKYYIFLLLLGCATCELSAQQAATTKLSQLPDSVLYGRHIVLPKEDAAYSSFSVGSEVFDKSPHIDVASALYGEIPGLVVHQGYGPSANQITSVTIGGKTPLVLIDGFTRSFSDIVTSEIASISVLRDAAAAAIYGVQGANGVVFITTKRGTDSPLKVTANYQFGLSTKFREPTFADSYTYAYNLNQTLLSDNANARYNYQELQAFKNGTYSNAYPDVDWMSEIYNDMSYNHRANFTFTGGNSKFKYFSAVDYMSDVALLNDAVTDDRYSIKPSDTRLSLRANLDVKITPTTDMQIGVMTRLVELNQSNNALEAVNAVYATPSAAFPIRAQDGIYGGTPEYGFNNPVALLNETGAYRLTTGTMLANITLAQDLSVLTEGLSIDVSAAFDYVGIMNDRSTKEFRYYDYGATINIDGELETDPKIYGEDSQTLDNKSEFESLAMNTELQAKLSYEKRFGSHNLSANVIYRQSALTAGERNASIKRQTFLGTVSYGYDERYLVDAVVSYSGSSYLPKDERFTLYPAVNLGWVISNESFLKNSTTVSFLKLFASYGLSGSEGALEHELYQQSYGDNNAGEYFFSKSVLSAWGQAEGDLPVEGLSPELSEKFSAGIEARFLDDRLAFYANGFMENRSEILVNARTVSGMIGIGVSKLNIGIIDSKGVDLALSWSDNLGDFGYQVRANASYFANKMVFSGQGYEQYEYLYDRGNSSTQRYGLEAIGIFQSQVEINNSTQQKFSTVRPGDIKYKDQNGDNRIDGDDIVRMYGSNYPALTYGFGLGFSYKGIGLSADFQGMAGVTVNLLDSPIYQPFSNDGRGTLSTTLLDRETPWTPSSGSKATMPRLTTEGNSGSNNYQNSSMWYRDGSFLKLRNVTLSYTIPKRIIKIAEVEVYLQATNLFSLDGIEFMDPEQLLYSEKDSYNSQSWINYPSTRAYWFGAKFNF